MTEKVMIIGWDGATWDYIDPMLAQGKLPHLAKLLANGSRATLKSTIPPFTNIAWPSLVTGLYPAKTGVYDATCFWPNSYDVLPTNLSGFRGIPIWQWVNQFGKEAAVLNVPMTYPARPLAGYLVSGFDSPTNAIDTVYPRNIQHEWERQNQPYTTLHQEIALMDSQNPHHDRGELPAFVDGWARLLKDQGSHAAWLWQNYPVDMMFIVFSGTDSINHRTHDFAAITAVYQATDDALGKLMAAIDEHTLLCLLSDHGSTPAYRYFNYYRVLAENGWLNFRPEVAQRNMKRLPTLINRLWQKSPPFVRNIFSWPLLKWDGRLQVGFRNIDWLNTKVFCRSGMGPLYINLDGHWPKGIVPQEDYESLLQAVKATFLSLRDEQEQPLIEKVWSKEELYQDSDDHSAPDLIVEPAHWTDHTITGFPTSQLVRTIPETQEYGTHTPDGVLLFHGPGVRKRQKLPQANIIDPFPTILAAWGLPIPMNVDGKPLQDVFEFKLHDKRIAAIEEKQQIGVNAHSDEILKRLKALGYLE